MKIIGYYASWDETMKIENINYEYLTHINYAFLIPKKDGSLRQLESEKVKKLIKYSHKNKVKVFISVGGWSFEGEKLNAVFEKISDTKKTLNDFIKNILKVVEEFQFDGVDMDWEYPTEKYRKEYEYLIASLKQSLIEKKKELSIAIPPGINVDNSIYGIEAITEQVCNIVDWINLMVYDNKKEENHASLRYAELAIKFWRDKKKVAKDKIILGVPFYSSPSNLPYRNLIEKNTKNYTLDIFENEHYNGAETLKKKVELARKNSLGIMIWAINYDTLNSYSLLKVIYQQRFKK